MDFPPHRRCAAASLLVLALAACAARGPAVPATASSIEGRVTAREAASVMVVASAPSPGGYDRASVRLDAATRVLRADGTRVSADTLAVGQSVRAWFDGPVMESYPVQAHASTIVIDSEVP
jgi:hypothetical protein